MAFSWRNGNSICDYCANRVCKPSMVYLKTSWIFALFSFTWRWSENLTFWTKLEFIMPSTLTLLKLDIFIIVVSSFRERCTEPSRELLGPLYWLKWWFFHLESEVLRWHRYIGMCRYWEKHPACRHFNTVLSEGVKWGQSIVKCIFNLSWCFYNL